VQAREVVRPLRFLTKYRPCASAKHIPGSSANTNHGHLQNTDHVLLERKGTTGAHINNFHARLDESQGGNAALMESLGLGKVGPDRSAGIVERGVPGPLIHVCGHVVEGVDHLDRVLLAVVVPCERTVFLSFCIRPAQHPIIPDYLHADSDRGHMLISKLFSKQGVVRSSRGSL
jgi:hypothetical protein